jgi:hypothetical protein
MSCVVCSCEQETNSTLRRCVRTWSRLFRRSIMLLSDFCELGIETLVSVESIARIDNCDVLHKYRSLFFDSSPSASMNVVTAACYN